MISFLPRNKGRRQINTISGRKDLKLQAENEGFAPPPDGCLYFGANTTFERKINIFPHNNWFYFGNDETAQHKSAAIAYRAASWRGHIVAEADLLLSTYHCLRPMTFIAHLVFLYVIAEIL